MHWNISISKRKNDQILSENMQTVHYGSKIIWIHFLDKIEKMYKHVFCLSSNRAHISFSLLGHNNRSKRNAFSHLQCLFKNVYFKKDDNLVQNTKFNSKLYWILFIGQSAWSKMMNLNIYLNFLKLDVLLSFSQFFKVLWFGPKVYSFEWIKWMWTLNESNFIVRICFFMDLLTIIRAKWSKVRK